MLFWHVARLEGFNFSVKITTVLDSKPTKSVENFEESKFSVGDHQFLLECCPKLIKTYNFGQNAVNERQFKNKNEQNCAVWLFNFKVAEIFCRFSVLVSILYRVCRWKFLMGFVIMKSPHKLSCKECKGSLLKFYCIRKFMIAFDIFSLGQETLMIGVKFIH